MNIAVFASGNGSNLQAFIDDQEIKPHLKLVVVNVASATALNRAKAANINTALIEHKNYSSKIDFEQKIIERLRQYNINLIVLAGFMRILSPKFIQAYNNKIINIHPSLLPKYKGLNTHRQVLQNKDSKHGATVHLVTDELDSGKILMQDHFIVAKGDSIANLQAKTHRIEHQIFPKAVRLMING